MRLVKVGSVLGESLSCHGLLCPKPLGVAVRRRPSRGVVLTAEGDTVGPGGSVRSPSSREEPDSESQASPRRASWAMRPSEL